MDLKLTLYTKKINILKWTRYDREIGQEMNQKWSKSGTKINRKQQNGHEKTYKMNVNAFRNMYFKGHLGQADEFQVLQSFIHSKLKSLYSSILEQLTQG